MYVCTFFFVIVRYFFNFIIWFGDSWLLESKSNLRLYVRRWSGDIFFFLLKHLVTEKGGAFLYIGLILSLLSSSSASQIRRRIVYYYYITGCCWSSPAENREQRLTSRELKKRLFTLNLKHDICTYMEVSLFNFSETFKVAVANYIYIVWGYLRANHIIRKSVLSEGGSARWRKVEYSYWIS